MITRTTTILIIILLSIIPFTVKAEKTNKTPSDLDQSPQAIELIEAFKKAHNNKNVDELMKLVYWGKATEQTKKGIRESLKYDINHSISNIYIGQLPDNLTTEYTLGSITYKINLKLIKELNVLYESNESGITRTSYLIGIRNGKYFIATAAPSD